MRRYSFGNSIIGCELPLAPLPLAGDGDRAGAAPDVLVEFLAPTAGDSREHESQGYRLRFPGLCDIRVAGDGSSVRVRTEEGAELATVRRLLLDQVLPKVFDLRGQLVLHAGAVGSGDRAILFIGSTGAGKSTLTRYFQHRGHPLLTDDALIIEPAGPRARAIPTYRSMRLWPDSFAALHRGATACAELADERGKLAPRDPETIDEQARPRLIDAVFLLDGVAEPAVKVTALAPAEGCMVLVANAFQLTPEEPVRARQRLEQAARLCRQTPLYGLRYPREFSRLGEVYAALSRLCAGGVPGKQRL